MNSDRKLRPQGLDCAELAAQNIAPDHEASSRVKHLVYPQDRPE
jgi:hypothetical protein